MPTIDPPTLALDIMDEHYFKTLKGTRTMYYYDDGVYRPGGKDFLENLIETKWPEVSGHQVREIVGHVERRTLTDFSEFNKEKHLVPVRNGLYNRETGDLDPFNPDILLTSKLPVEYDDFAVCPDIIKFLEEVLYPDDVKVMQELVGYFLAKHYKFAKFFVLVGQGGNGKTLWINVLTNFLGVENIAGASMQDLTKDSFAGSDLFGMVANICDDMSEKALKNTGNLKVLTGGGLKGMRVQRKHKDGFYFFNTAKMIFACNQVPKSPDDTDSFMDRVGFLVFPHKFRGTSRDNPNLLDDLIVDCELSGLFNWALEGLDRLEEQRGFSNGKSTEQVRAQYHWLANPIAAFLDECTERNSASVSKDILYGACVQYCISREVPPPSKRQMTEEIYAQLPGVREEKVRENGSRVVKWKGIIINDSGVKYIYSGPSGPISNKNINAPEFNKEYF